ncbi:hypothetical protein D3C83_73560 [compost metagenome]
MSTPTVARLFEKRKFFANLRSKIVVRSPRISFGSSSCTPLAVAEFRAVPRQPVPCAAAAPVHGSLARPALSGSHMMSFLL